MKGLYTLFHKDMFRPTVDMLSQIYSAYFKSYVKHTFGNLLNFATIIPTAFIAIASNTSDPLDSTLLNYSYYFILVATCICMVVGANMVVTTLLAMKFERLFSKGVNNVSNIPSGMALLTIGLFSAWLNNVGVNSMFSSYRYSEDISHISTMMNNQHGGTYSSIKDTREEIDALKSQLLQVEIKYYEEILSRHRHEIDKLHDEINYKSDLSNETTQIEKSKI